MSLTIILSPEVESIVRSRVANDEEIASEIDRLIRRAITYESAGELTPEEIEGIEQAIDYGDADIAEGRITPADDVFSRFRMKYGNA